MVQTLKYRTAAGEAGPWMFGAGLLGAVEVAALTWGDAGLWAGWLCGGLVAAIALLGLWGWLQGVGTLCWDHEGLSLQSVVQRRALRWSQLGALEVRAGACGEPRYALRDVRGRPLVIDGHWLGHAGAALLAELAQRAEPHLAAQCREAAGLGLEVPAGADNGVARLSVALMALCLLGLAGLIAASLNDGLVGLAASQGLGALASLAGLRYVWRLRSQRLRLSPDGLWYGPGLARCLAWQSVSCVEVTRTSYRGAVNEIALVRGPRVALRLSSQSSGYLAARAVLRARATSARLVEQASALAPAAWRVLLETPQARSGPAVQVDPHLLDALPHAASPALLRALRAAPFLLVVAATTMAVAGVLLAPDHRRAQQEALADLAAGTAHAKAVITQFCDVHPPRHAHYDYTVNGCSHNGRTSSMAAAGGREWRLGDTLEVVYSPRHPAESRPLAEPAQPVPSLAARPDRKPVGRLLLIVGAALFALGWCPLLWARWHLHRLTRRWHELLPPGADS